jgi:hypothetical protein
MATRSCEKVGKISYERHDMLQTAFGKDVQREVI